MHIDVLTNSVYLALNKELMRRILIKYFFEKGMMEDMDGRVYPPLIQDICTAVPQLQGKIDIVPHVEDVNAVTGVVTLGWNLFVLGNERMYLGESNHTNLQEIKTMICGPINSCGIKNIEYKSPKRIISFIVDVLSKSKSGDLSRTDNRSMTPSFRGISNDQGSFFRKNTFVN